MEESVDILILTYQRKAYVQELLEQLYLKTEYPFRILLIDNGSTDGTREWLQKMKEIGLVSEYLFTETNLPMAEAYTLGMKMLVKSTLFVVTQDDLVPPLVNPCWLTQLMSAMNENPEFATISLSYNNCGWTKYLRDVKPHDEKLLSSSKQLLIKEIKNKIYDDNYNYSRMES